MSETPRTDAAFIETQDGGSTLLTVSYPAAHDLCRSLERELAGVRSMLDARTKENVDLRVSASAWIPVSKLLPDPIDRYVLVRGVNPRLYGHREFHVCALDDGDHGFTGPASGWRWMTEAGNVIHEVTHWMYLPEPPKS